MSIKFLICFLWPTRVAANWTVAVGQGAWDQVQEASRAGNGHYSYCYSMKENNAKPNGEVSMYFIYVKVFNISKMY